MATNKGRFSPRNPQKYKGDPTKIIYRSGWECRVMIYFDRNENVLEWSSEEVIVPYKSPIDGKWHRYFPDFIVKLKDKDGKISTKMIEVKPYAQTRAPEPLSEGKKPTRRYITEVVRYGINLAKWNAAKQYCADRKWEFHILTEKELKV
jgi:hypothetical protein